MNEKQAIAVGFLAHYTNDGANATGLTVTANIWLGGTKILNAQAATEWGDGLYFYEYPALSNDTDGLLTAVFDTAGTVDARNVAGLRIIGGGGVANLDASIASRSSHSAADVWAVTTRTLSSFGTLAADVWAVATRTLTAFAFTPTPSNAADTTAIKAKTDNLPASPAAVGSAMTLTSGERTSIGTAVWASTTRTLSSFGTLAADVWAVATRTLTAFAFTPTPSNAADTTAIKAKTDNLPASPAAVGSAMTLTSGERTSIGTAVWASTTRTLSSFGTLAADVWAVATRTLTAFAFTPTPSNAAEQTAIKAKTDLIPASGIATVANQDAIKAKTDLIPASGIATEAKQDTAIAGIALVKAKTDLLPNDPASQSVAVTLPSPAPEGYGANIEGDITAELSAETEAKIDAIKTQTDRFAAVAPGDPIAAGPAPVDPDMCRVEAHLYEFVSGKVNITFQLMVPSNLPAKAGKMIAGRKITVPVDDGVLDVEIPRNDSISPSGSYYEVTSGPLALNKRRITLDSSNFNLGSLIS